MLIKSISLTNFRNHSTYHLDCNPDTTLILGENGWGKTSILEAIYILTQGKSFRASDNDIVKRGTDFYRIELEYENGEKSTATFTNGKKFFTIKDKKSSRISPKNKYPTILFLPNDLNLVSGSPSRHREYFDRYFSVLSPRYHEAILRYDKALKQRNELLKQEFLDKSTLFSWDLLLSKYGAMISSLRNNYTDEINQRIEPTYHSIAENSDKIKLNYLTEKNNITENEYLNILEKSHEKDCYLGHTTFGIHKDNYEFIFNQKPADGSASRGETRSIILALKFVEASIIEEKLHKKPLILLDDVFSELDQKRRNSLVDNFKNHQAIITSIEA